MPDLIPTPIAEGFTPSPAGTDLKTNRVFGFFSLCVKDIKRKLNCPAFYSTNPNEPH